ncbi:MAG TPA: hypothetical protein VF581_07860 [Flavobacterium sp.]|jgi:hypothetical protein
MPETVNIIVNKRKIHKQATQSDVEFNKSPVLEFHVPDDVEMSIGFRFRVQILAVCKSTFLVTMILKSGPSPEPGYNEYQCIATRQITKL